MSTPVFNPAQLATWAEAIALRKTINYSPVFYTKGLQILPWWGNVTTATSGIYVPIWVPGPHGDPEPNSGNSFFLHFRFSNGFEGMNVGLVREKFASFPLSPLYVLGTLLAEVQGARS